MEAVPITLGLPQDPSADVVMIQWQDDCRVYFTCRDASGGPADFLGCVHFKNWLDARCIESDTFPYRVTGRSCRPAILRVAGSRWVREALARRWSGISNPQAVVLTEYFHFVVAGHGNFAEVVAPAYTIERLPHQQARHIRRWFGHRL
jgi:hypothetical protein